MGGNAFTSFPAGVGAVGGWVELGRTTLGSASDTINVGSLANKRYYMYLVNVKNSGQISWHFRLGSGSIDTSTNYASRGSSNGAPDATAANATEMNSRQTGGSFDGFAAGYIANLSGEEKLLQWHTVEEQPAGPGNAPSRGEGIGKWNNVSNPLDTFGVVELDSGQLATGSEVVILEWDPTDVHTNNFWEELDSTDFSGSADSFTSSTFTAKKYLWVQCYLEGTADMRPFAVQFNSDTGVSYSFRRAHNGIADAVFTNTNHIEGQGGADVTNVFWNMFIINNSANEKLCYIESVSVVTQGAGTAPFRDELAGKWTNTSSQITSITVLDRSSGKITTGKLRVFGAD